MVKLISPADGAVVSQQTERQTYFRAHSRELAVSGQIDWQHLTHTGERDNSFPAPVVFAWEGEDSAAVQLSLDPDLREAVVIPGENGSARVQNLLLGRTYYWSVGDSEVRSFTTEETAPRWIFAEGTTNVRDAGGWVTEDGRKIRQGLLFRGSEMDTHMSVTERGIRTLRDKLGIRTDLDLRGEAVGKVTESPLGSDVRFILLPANAGEAFEENPQNIREIFEVLADPDNYPVYYHCWGGADRTGLYGYMLGAVLGMREEDLILDYELTSLSVWGCRSRSSEGCPMLLKCFAPDCRPIGERITGFLLAQGVTMETMDAIRRILLED